MGAFDDSESANIEFTPADGGQSVTDAGAASEVEPAGVEGQTAEAVPETLEGEAKATEQQLILGKFKSQDDLTEAYKNLESEMGRLRNEVGASRKSQGQPPEAAPQDSQPANQIEQIKEYIAKSFGVESSDEAFFSHPVEANAMLSSILFQSQMQQLNTGYQQHKQHLTELQQKYPFLEKDYNQVEELAKEIQSGKMSVMEIACRLQNASTLESRIATQKISPGRPPTPEMGGSQSVVSTGSPENDYLSILEATMMSKTDDPFG